MHRWEIFQVLATLILRTGLKTNMTIISAVTGDYDLRPDRI